MQLLTVSDVHNHIRAGIEQIRECLAQKARAIADLEAECIPLRSQLAELSALLPADVSPPLFSAPTSVAPLLDPNPGHLPVPDGQSVGRAARFEAAHPAAVRVIRQMMTARQAIPKDTIYAVLPPRAGKDMMLPAWMWREGWYQNKGKTGRQYRPINTRSATHTVWLACRAAMAAE